MDIALLIFLGVVSAGSLLFFANRYRAARPTMRGQLLWAAFGSAAVATLIGLLLASR
jgi:hypothetical protein